MRIFRLLSFIAVALVITQNYSEVRAQNQTKPQAQDVVGQPNTQPKLIKSPVGHFPDKGRKKNIDGKVELTVVVDEKGRVADAKVLSASRVLSASYRQR